MHSTWLDPLIKAQHTRRHAPAEVPLSRHEEDFAAGWIKRSKRRWELLDEEDASDWDSDPPDILPEMEREIGIAEWIDPQTGGPAEGQSPPHLEND
jgi:hypothetical protein